MKKITFSDHFWETRSKPHHELTADDAISIISSATEAFVEHERRSRHIFRKPMPGRPAPAKVVASLSCSDLKVITAYYDHRLVLVSGRRG